MKAEILVLEEATLGDFVPAQAAARAGDLLLLLALLRRAWERAPARCTRVSVEDLDEDPVLVSLHRVARRAAARGDPGPAAEYGELLLEKLETPGPNISRADLGPDLELLERPGAGGRDRDAAIWRSLGAVFDLLCIAWRIEHPRCDLTGGYCRCAYRKASEPALRRREKLIRMLDAVLADPSLRLAERFD
jgi:hypothetical protein